MLQELIYFLTDKPKWNPMNIGLRSNRPIPRPVNGRKAWKMRGKVPSKKYRRRR